MSSSRATELQDQIRASLARAIERGRWSVVEGGELDEFEAQVARIFGTEYAVATNSGTNALLGAASALGLARGARILVPAYGFYGMLAPFLFLGIQPVFVPFDLDSLCATVSDYRRGLSARPDAILVFHPWGNLGPAGEIARWAAEHGLSVVADLSHCHGASYEGSPIGAHSTVGAASFGRGKLISGGELGACMMDRRPLADFLVAFGHPNRRRRRLSGERPLQPSEYHSFGPKLRPHGLSLAMALPQFHEYDVRFEAAGEIGREMERIALEEHAGRPLATQPAAVRAYWRLVVQCSKRPEPAVIDSLERLGWKPDGGVGYSQLLSDHPICSSPGATTAIVRYLPGRWLRRAREQLGRLLHFEVRSDGSPWRESWQAAMALLRKAMS